MAASALQVHLDPDAGLKEKKLGIEPAMVSCMQSAALPAAALSPCPSAKMFGNKSLILQPIEQSLYTVNAPQCSRSTEAHVASLEGDCPGALLQVREHVFSCLGVASATVMGLLRPFAGIGILGYCWSCCH